MHRFVIHPIYSARPSMEIYADDAAAVLQFLKCTDCRHAHVDRDGQYAFSLSHGDDDVWQITVEKNNLPGTGMTSSEQKPHCAGS